MILKMLVGFLLGFILGVGGTVFMVTSGAGNYIIAANPRVLELEGKIRDVEGEREAATRRLAEVVRLTERMATRFEDLEDRFARLRAGDDGDAATDEGAAAGDAAVAPDDAAASGN
jgi:hypothetical protein